MTENDLIDNELINWVMGRRTHRIERIMQIVKMLNETYNYETDEKQELLLINLKAQVDSLTVMYPKREGVVKIDV